MAPIPVILIVGDTFKLTDYTRYSDYIKHTGEIGTVIGVNDSSYTFTWPDTTMSAMHKSECLSDWVIKQ